MADFGLAAQIGRGGAGGGMPQQTDPLNRMTQMMQLQQLQQNMMLAQELAARQREMQPLLLQEKREGIQTEIARRGLVGEQTGRAREERQQAERAGLAERGALEYIASTPPELRADPARLDALRRSNAGAYNYMSDTIARARALQEEARAKGFSADEAQFKFRQAALGGMSSLLPAVTEQTWPTVYGEFKSLDPVGSRVIGPDFTPENVAALRARVQNLSDLSFEKDEQGYEFIVNKRTGEKTPIVKRGPNPPAQSTFGALDQGAQMASTQLIGQGAASMASPNAMQPPGAAPIIQPRATAPGAAELKAAAPAPVPAGLPPRATAEAEKVRATELAKRAVAELDKDKGREAAQATLNDMIESYKRLGALGALQRKDQSRLERLGIAATARLPGDIATVVDFDVGSELSTIDNLRQSLIPVLTEVMGAKAVDAASESQRIINSLTSGGQSPEAIVRTLNNFSKKYGTGTTFKVEDLAYKPPEGAPTGGRRGAAPAPAPAAAPAAATAPAAGARPSLQEFLAKAKPLNPNASDADLTAYYNRTYGGR